MRLVISAVNFTDGGPLKILRDAVRSVTDNFPEWEVIVLVNRLGIAGNNKIQEVEFPYAKKSWFIRLWLEWYGFYKLSNRLRPDVWLSLHDITPRVAAKRQYVYCHNPAIFSTKKILFQSSDFKFVLFKKLYGYLYRIFIYRNSAVIVQQSWIRDEFIRRYSLNRVIVAYPNNFILAPNINIKVNRPFVFLYPAFPRVFKNFEVLGECIEILEKESRWGGEIIITIDGSENQYAKIIKKKFSYLKSLKFVGKQDPALISQLYTKVDALIFPSLLETWGLPLTEAKCCNLPIIAADLPYAHETIGTYNKVRFFPPNDAVELARLILSLHLGSEIFFSSVAKSVGEPFTNDWKDLFEIMLVKDN